MLPMGVMVVSSILLPRFGAEGDTQLAVAGSWQPKARPARRSQGARSAPRSGLGLDAEHGSGTPATIGMRPFPAEEIVGVWQRPALLLRECWPHQCATSESFCVLPKGPNSS